MNTTGWLKPALTNPAIKKGTRGPWNLRPPGPPAGPLSHLNPKSRDPQHGLTGSNDQPLIPVNHRDWVHRYMRKTTTPTCTTTLRRTRRRL